MQTNIEFKRFRVKDIAMIYVSKQQNWNSCSKSSSHCTPSNL